MTKYFVEVFSVESQSCRIVEILAISTEEAEHFVNLELGENEVILPNG